MTTEKLASRAGVKTAGVGLLTGVAGTWFLVAFAAASKGVAVVVAVAAAAYFAGEGDSDGE